MGAIDEIEKILVKKSEVNCTNCNYCTKLYNSTTQATHPNNKKVKLRLNYFVYLLDDNLDFTETLPGALRAPIGTDALLDFTLVFFKRVDEPLSTGLLEIDALRTTRFFVGPNSTSFALCPNLHDVIVSTE